MNNQNANIDLNQTQRTESNHELDSQALFEKMKVRIVELMQRCGGIGPTILVKEEI